MNPELSQVRRRSAIHAALSDPARLQVVDMLAETDLSPANLAAALGMTSNLLAHHLNVLDSSGLIRRLRSEGDRRRVYLQLVPEALAGLAWAPSRTARRVLFVCTANSARSQLAAALWHRASSVPAASAGTHPAERINPGALDVAERHRLSLRRVRPRRLSAVRRPGDLIVTVCDAAHEELHGKEELRWTAELHWSVPDPVPIGTPAAFDSAFEHIAARVADLAPRLVPAS